MIIKGLDLPRDFKDIWITKEEDGTYIASITYNDKQGHVLPVKLLSGKAIGGNGKWLPIVSHTKGDREKIQWVCGAEMEVE